MKEFSQLRLRMGKHVLLVRSKGEKPAKVLEMRFSLSNTIVKVPDRQNEALWCHVMMGGKVWQEVLAQREEGEESRIVQVLWSTVQHHCSWLLIFPIQGDVKGETPTVTFLTSIPVHVCETLLDYLTSWLAVTGWKEEYGAWIYAVLTRFIFPSLFLHIAGSYCLGWRSP